MKNKITLAAIFILSSLWTAGFIYGQDDLKIWNEFIQSLKDGSFTSAKIKPYYEEFKEPMVKWLIELMEESKPESWDRIPEIFVVEDHVHFILPLSFSQGTRQFCFTFLKEGQDWHFRHLEGIFIRLDKVSSLPASRFPDLPEVRKAWMREEIYWSKMIMCFYNVISKENGKDFAANLFKDGGGYFVAAKTWVPFVIPQKAFVLYLCWEQANLRGNSVTLEKLENKEAVVKISPHFFALYKRTSHMRQNISFEDYKNIFEVLWQDRAKNAGWTLDIIYEDEECLNCTFKFSR